MGWTARNIPDQSGRTVVVTGANSGLGFVTARELARRGARTVLACRDEERGSRARDELVSELPEAGPRTELRRLDLGDLASVRAFVKELPDERVDLLINNAGVMALPYGRTADGFELQFGVNHLGHFALTGLLLDRLLAAPAPRVVTVSSGLHALANIDIADLNSEHSYRRWVAYARSKTANLLFTHELARLLAGTPLVAAAAHPGYAATNLQTAGVRMEGRKTVERVFALGNRVVAQSAEAGALPTLYAATARGVAPDSFTGPRLLGWRGAPAPSWRAPWTLSDVAAERLWAASEQLTGVTYGVPS
ncbi:oxidoreductase [Streptomyces smyrnaeus]|uniref:oxidoreductase n=1 Tax=Streptomyces TaxID=1883 RepID=UPI000C1855D6|nr:MULTISPECIES: oxidoreductase [unclassified Streptomyces]MBQ0863232.1 SDR family NAD(P)-dependent oxidoreductase [Streptomyces sp. RK75]MBQ1123732.1 SDR family NAD(P)-dependent oxidoreductase [Streptomyces sp. B15]MBQ1159766.1 SDR family NAD(P)-dependent oxidoreductase [Streptomyces sp. A73]